MKAITRKILLVTIDVFLIIATLYFAYFIRFDGMVPIYTPNEWAFMYISLVIIAVAVNSFFHLYSSLWSYAGVDELLSVIASGIITAVLYYVAIYLTDISMPRSIYVLVLLLDVVFLGVSRLGYRAMRWIYNTVLNEGVVDSNRVMVVGAGEAGVMVIKELKAHCEMGLKPVVLIDDDKAKKGFAIKGIKIYGGKEKIIEAVNKYRIDTIIIAMPSASKSKQKEILNICKKTKCKLKTVPGMYELIDGSISIKEIRDVEIEDLLGRDPINLNVDEICGYIKDETVLVTGGGGSIGSELCRQIARFDPKQLLILDIYENNAYELQQELKRTNPELNQRVIIASIRDRAKMEEVFETYRPGVVFHAAAHKHVPLMEENPSEAIKNNVFGTLNVAESADKFGVKRFVTISTDKAVNPTNIMGATKRITEMIMQAISKVSKTEFVAVRFGNVLGSNGSVIPLFKKQIAEGGPVTVTHPEITRYFMKISEAVQLVLEAGSMAKGGEIFVLDMGDPVKIDDLARDLIKLSGFEPDVDIKIEYTELRPGEKLYEELLMDEEGLTNTVHDKIFIGKPMDIDINELKEELEKLKFVMNGTSEDLKEYVMQIVPTYTAMKEKAAPSRE